MGVVGFCDDILHMALTRSAMQAMLDTCEQYAGDHNLQFSTDPDPSKSKTKSIFICGGNKNLQKPVNLTLCGSKLPWVQSATHLGHELHESGEMENDVNVKRAKFIDTAADIADTFSFASPVEVLTATKLYACSLYGSMTWNLYGEKAGQLFRSWNTCVKLAWNVPRSAHTYFVT